jgi:hypothetical protein
MGQERVQRGRVDNMPGCGRGHSAVVCHDRPQCDAGPLGRCEVDGVERAKPAGGRVAAASSSRERLSATCVDAAHECTGLGHRPRAPTATARASSVLASAAVNRSSSVYRRT